LPSDGEQAGIATELKLGQRFDFATFYDNHATATEGAIEFALLHLFLLPNL
jgi:hypothetical protein